jgi:hypothetical protein
MGFLQNATDDQLALMFCVGGLVVSGCVMYFSLHLGRLTGVRRDVGTDVETQGAKLRLAPVAELVKSEVSTKEKAA